MQPGQQWATIIRDGTTDAQVIAVVRAINATTAERRANRGAVMVACAQVLAQNIAADPEIAADIRAGILALIDGYAMAVAVMDPTP